MKGGWSRLMLVAVAVATALRLAARGRRRTVVTPREPARERVIVAPAPEWESPPRNLKRWLAGFAAVALLLGGGGFLVAASGIIPIKASSGHWGITRWFLQFSKSRSVATHTMTMKAPVLTNSWQIFQGAGHFETGCAPCHGSPARPRNRVAAAMLPPPPDLKYIATQRESAELFYIVKHGIKFTGMPAWPALEREDEIWSVVAFLRRLPVLEAEEYNRFAWGGVTQGAPSSDVPTLIRDHCARCHGAEGSGHGAGAFPKLAGQKRDYLMMALDAYARGSRPSGFMEPLAAPLNSSERSLAADYYSSLPEWSRAPTSATNGASIQRGREIAAFGIPERAVPACADCHLAPEAKNSNYPKIAGQYARYLEQQLELFKNGGRGGTKYSHIMQRAAAGLTGEDIRDVAAYFEAEAASDSTTNLTSQ